MSRGGGSSAGHEVDTLRWRETFVTDSAGAIHAIVEAGHGRPILLLHDVAPVGCTDELRDLFDGLRGERPLVLPDLSDLALRLRPEDHAVILVRVVEELVRIVEARYGAAVDVVASGVMAKIATRAVRMAPRHVRSLVLLSPPPPRSGLARLVRKALAGPVSFGCRAAAAVPAFARPLLLAAARLRLSTELDTPTWAPLRTPMLVVGGEAGRATSAATAAALVGFWSTLAVKPELRLISGARTTTRPAPRRVGQRPRLTALRLERR